jgi:hypothetical protein
MRKRLPIICLLLSCLLLPFTARSADLEIRADGDYVMGAGETMAITEERGPQWLDRGGDCKDVERLKWKRAGRGFFENL